jgi:hypothetical protein
MKKRSERVRPIIVIKSGGGIAEKIQRQKIQKYMEQRILPIVYL